MRRITTCRVCKSTKLRKIGSLGDIALSNFTDTPTVGKRYPLTLLYCSNCTLLQLAHNTPREAMYKNYWYESHINPVIVNDLKEVTKYINPSDVHIDIGANDGTLLKFSNARFKIGVDPSNIKPQIKCSWFNDYWENIYTLLADKITAIACLYDLPDPNKFMRNIKRHLAINGVFISQFQPLEKMIELNDVGNICHEHLEYYSYKSLRRLFEQNGLEIYKVEENDINGGSYRVFARHFIKGSIDYKEKTYNFPDLKEFFNRLEENKKKMVEFFNNHNVIGFGASTKMGTIIQYYGITPQIVVDANPNKLGKFTVGGAIITDKIPDFAEYLWVFPYGFLDYFQEKEKDYKGKWVTSIPEFKVI